MSKVKYWGGLTFVGNHGQKRTIVASTSKKAAAEALGLSLHAFNQYWSETGNKAELAVLQANEPGVVFVNISRQYSENPEFIRLSEI